MVTSMKGFSIPTGVEIRKCEIDILWYAWPDLFCFEYNRVADRFSALFLDELMLIEQGRFLNRPLELFATKGRA